MVAQARVMSQLPTLVVDLDGTLLRTDALWEGLLHLLRNRPWRLLGLLLWLPRGRAYVKARIAAESRPAVELLPYREELLRWLRTERQRGRRIILATAASHGIGEMIAQQTGLFDAVITSTDTVNNRGREKLRRLRQIIGEEPFEYVGNSMVDTPIWAAATAVHVVGTPRFVRRVRRRFPAGHDFLQRWSWRPFLRLLRLHQWLKNLLVFVPIVLAHRLSEWQLWGMAALAFVALSLVASGL
ncbi:MAG: haloacid dehalogenase-like hydrolase, partial [Candidatus Kapabacteria bacterium]|nr:haloacid dehalogenase-like hydrolase [Candidatus Kapabacteria bacterium]MDW7996645.1 haloacid dehalogenase-like hydrolase [Bacteroidota bacterium]